MNHHMSFAPLFDCTVFSGFSGHFKDFLEQTNEFRINDKQFSKHFHFQPAVRQKAPILFGKGRFELLEYLGGAAFVIFGEGKLLGHLAQLEKSVPINQVKSIISIYFSGPKCV
jgi:hypothetical protein